MAISFTLNGRSMSLDAAPGERLSHVLRERLGLTGTKVGCDAGDCGACTILLDGAPVCACLTAVAQVEGRAITTVEGLAENGAFSRLQASFLHHGAAQCGICTPAMLVAATALLAHTPRPDRDQVEDALGGVLCRCTGYRKIIDAVMNAGDFAAAPETLAGGAGIGQRIVRLDGADKVSGREKFGADMRPDGAVLVRIVRSPHAHAGFRIGDVAAFVKSHPGVLAVYTAADIAGRNRFGVIPPYADQPVFAEETVRFRGEAVAAVIGEAEAIERLDLREFPVSWTPLPALTTPRAAESADAPPIHDGRGGNLLAGGFVERGDPERGLAEATHTAEGRFTTPFIEHAYIEPEAGHARRHGDRIEIFGCTQAPHMDREAIAEILGLDVKAVRIVPSGCGGGFGSKLDLSFQPYVALAAWHLGRPAAIAYGRTESMQSTTKRHPSEIRLRIGCDAAGKIMAMDFDGVFDTGAYASWGPTVANRVPVHASGPYFTPNYVARARAVHTHNPPGGAFRGFGVPQALVAVESLYDVLAEKVGMDRLEFRLANALRDGQPTVTGQVFERGVGIVACLEALRPAWRAAMTRAREHNARPAAVWRRGVGLATCWYGCGNTALPNPSTMRIGVTAEGRVRLHQGAVDIGQGANTVIAQIAAEALGITVGDLDLVGADTDLTPDAGKTSASRQTFISGNAAKLAGAALRAKILRHANVSASARLHFGDHRIELADGADRVTIELATLPVDELGYVFRSEESYDPPTAPLDEKGQGRPYAVFGYGAQIVELGVDVALGTVRLERITAAHDVGRAINPTLAEGQIEGGIAQGIGLALMEEYIPGRSENLHDYLIPGCGDMPEIETLLIEVEDPVGPYGAKGLGEHVLIPTAPAILNAIRHATGASIRDLPATPERVRAAIREAENHG